MSKSNAPFVIYGKSDDIKYSIRTADGEAVATRAYNTFFRDRTEWAQLIVDALNAHAPAVAKATGQPLIQS